MQADKRIQQVWLELFDGMAIASELMVKRLGNGYYAAVLRAVPDSTVSRPVAASAYERLKPYIPHLERTRAVPLNGPSSLPRPHSENLASWAGGLAADIENGKLHALAVVDTEEFKYHFLAAMAECGWQVQARDSCLRIQSGRFVERVNLLNALVCMVHSRGTMATAAQTVIEEIQRRFARNAALFLRFRQRFQPYHPAILDHYFVARPGTACVSAGWDYWEISEKTLAESELEFQQAMDELEGILTGSRDAWPPNLLVGGCDRNDN
jgi:hypothetical protein